MIGGVPEDRRCLVVGAGLLGLSAACALAQRGWAVEVLEAGDDIGHARAGSKGEARIFRLGYREPAYVAMAVRARDLWHELEQASGRVLLHRTAQLSFGDQHALAAVEAALTALDAPYEEVAAVEARARFPGIAVSGGPALLEPASGVLAADECLRALRAVGRFPVRTGVAVTGIEQDGATVRVATAGGPVHEADIVVDCAGPAALGLLGAAAGCAVAAPPSAPQVAYFRATSSSSAPLPVFIEWGDEMVYGLPVPDGGPHGGTYKLSHHAPGGPLEQYDPTDAAPFAEDRVLLASLVGAARRLLPALDPKPVATERCVYDNTADTDFVLDRVGRVVVGCGTSGHGFKFGPLFGELLADLAEDRPPCVDLARFRLGRPPRSAGGPAAAGR
jgi:sarcosine oxidase